MIPVHRLLPLFLAGALPLGIAACGESTGPGPEPVEALLFLSSRAGGEDQFGRPLRDIYRLDSLDAPDATNLTGQPRRHYINLSLSPDGRRVLFGRDGAIFVWPLDDPADQ
jgi:hypothetical protein